MAQTVPLNSKGFTLLESMIATLLLAIIMLWTMQSMLSAYNFTARNQLRNEGIRLAGEALTDIRNTPYLDFVPGASPPVLVQRQIRSFDATYSIIRTVTTAIGGLAFDVNINVSWNHKNTPYNYAVSTIVANK